jgi:hypothetical protein
MLSCSFSFFLLRCPTMYWIFNERDNCIKTPEALSRYVLSVHWHVHIAVYKRIFTWKNRWCASDWRQRHEAIKTSYISNNSWHNFPDHIVLFMGPSCACFCSIDEWRHATKHRLKIDAACEFDDQSKRAKGRKSISISNVCVCIYTI